MQFFVFSCRGVLTKNDLSDSISLFTRLYIFWTSSTPAASTSDLATLALIVLPLSSGRAEQLWARAARGAERVRPHERLVLEGTTVHEAAERLAAVCASEREERAPIEVLARVMLEERMRKHAAVLFVHAVSADEGEEGEEVEGGEEEKARQVSIEAAQSLGGRVAELAESLESAWKTDADDAGAELVAEENDEGAGALLAALGLYRRSFPARARAAQVLSPPPSPGGDDGARVRGWRVALRNVLAAEVFEGKEGGRLWARVEDAKDKLVDMLVEGDRMARSCK